MASAVQSGWGAGWSLGRAALLLLAAGCAGGAGKDTAGADDGGADGADGADGSDGADGADGVDPNDQDADGVPLDLDCDDLDPAVGAATPWAPDADLDGFGDDALAVSACEAPAGHVAAGGDCDDADPLRSPGAAEVCDGVDNDCDLLLDGDDTSVDLDTVTLAYVDADADGYGVDGTEVYHCGPMDGLALAGGDCDDADPLASPETLWYPDLDGDTYGEDAGVVAQCLAPETHIAAGGDCDDDDPDVNPLGLEVCDGLDNDCDAAVDDTDPDVDLSTGADFFADADSDGFGDDAAVTRACAAPAGASPLGGDCDDGAPAVNPGADEVCGDGLDSDCDGRPGAWCAGGPVSAADADRWWAGAAGSDEAGKALDGAGDLDGDGFEDLAVGAQLADPAGSSSGAVHVVFGGPTALGGDLGAEPALSGALPYDYLGSMVAGAGDVNGDGYDDLIVGMRGTDLPLAAAGSAAVVLGGPRWAGQQGISDRAWSLIRGTSTSDGLGEGVGPAGDTDGDGFADVLLGAKDADPGGVSSAGAVYLLYGGATMAAEQSAADLARFEAGVLNDYLGNLYSLGGGDLDGDGLDEFWAGAYGYDVSPGGGGTVSFQGAVFIWAGQATRRSGVNSAADADGRIEGRPWLSGSSQLGYANSRRSGDVNGDGYGDLLSGAYFYDEGGTDSGAAFLYLGGPAGFVGVRASPDLSAARVVGEDRYDYCGKSVDIAPDVNGDGFDELWVGCYGQDDAGNVAGSAVLALGAAEPAARTAISTADLRLDGAAAGDSLGHAVTSLDLNGDGLGDLVAGAYGANSSAGGAALIFGNTGAGLGL